MLNLILVIMSIALTASLAYASVTYLSPEDGVRQTDISYIESGLRGLQNGYSDYVAETGNTPTSLSQISPQYVFTPTAPKGLAWSYGSGAYSTSFNGTYFCLSGSAMSVEVQAAEDLESTFSPEQYFVNSSCGATSDATVGSTLAITFWNPLSS